MTKCFFLEPTGRARRSLRRYQSGGSPGCPHGYHDAVVAIDEVPAETPSTDDIGAFADDPRWPIVCQHCGEAFVETDQFQLFVKTLYRRIDTGEEMPIREAPPGAMWDATWFNTHPEYRGPDGRTIVVRCPDGRDWIIDGRASNCTLPDDDTHKCWVRHGEPPNLTVDKNGHTCAAGGGSIDTGKWHGFLRAGELVVA